MHGKAHMWRSVDKVVKYAIYATIFLDIYDIGCIGSIPIWHNLISECTTMWCRAVLCIIYFPHRYVNGRWLHGREKNHYGKVYNNVCV